MYRVEQNVQTSLDKCPTRLRDNKDFFLSIKCNLSLNLEFSYGLSFNLSDENEPLAYLSLNLVGHLSRDVCIYALYSRDCIDDV
jgi:hypothetical protein